MSFLLTNLDASNFKLAQSMLVPTLHSGRNQIARERDDRSRRQGSPARLDQIAGSGSGSFSGSGSGAVGGGLGASLASGKAVRRVTSSIIGS